MSLRIEYLLNGERVMVAVCPKSLAQCEKDAREGLARFNADTARIVDMDQGGRVIKVVKRNA